MSEKKPPTAAEMVTVWVDAYAKGSLVDHDKRLRSAARAVAARLGVELAPEEPERPGWFMREELNGDFGLPGDAFVQVNRANYLALNEAHSRAVRALRELKLVDPPCVLGVRATNALRILRDGKS